MVSENVAYQLQNFEEAEIDKSPVKWCSVTLSDIIARGKRLEASVYDVEAKQAREIVIHGKFPAIALGGDDGLTSSYTGSFSDVPYKKDRDTKSTAAHISSGHYK